MLILSTKKLWIYWSPFWKWKQPYEISNWKWIKMYLLSYAPDDESWYLRICGLEINWNYNNVE